MIFDFRDSNVLLLVDNAGFMYSDRFRFAEVETEHRVRRVEIGSGLWIDGSGGWRVEVAQAGLGPGRVGLE